MAASGRRRPPPAERVPPAIDAVAASPGKAASPPLNDDAPETVETAPDGTADLAPLVGANLKRLRSQRALSLEALAKRSGVSRAMLGQIELGRSAPTINVLWKISRALGVPFSALINARDTGGTRVLRVAQSRRLTSHDGSFSSRALFPAHEPRRVEFYELRLRAGGVERADPHPAGTIENLVVGCGRIEIEIGVGGPRHDLDAGDALYFASDVPHAYRNVGKVDALLYLVMTYADTVG